MKIAEIFQEINISDREYNNLIVFTVGSGVKGIAAVKACYSIENDKRLNVNFIQTSAYPVEKSLEVSEFRKALAVDNDSVLASPLEFSGWVDITYLDENFRLVRGNSHNLYVLVRND